MYSIDYFGAGGQRRGNLGHVFKRSRANSAKPELLHASTCAISHGTLCYESPAHGQQRVFWSVRQTGTRRGCDRQSSAATVPRLLGRSRYCQKADREEDGRPRLAEHEHQAKDTESKVERRVRFRDSPDRANEADAMPVRVGQGLRQE